MPQTCPIVIIAGFLGAGKSHLMRMLAHGAPIACIVDDWAPEVADSLAPDALGLPVMMAGASAANCNIRPMSMLVSTVSR